MADLRTDYEDDVLDTEVNELRKYQMIQNEDGTVSFEDVTEYAQVGDSFGSEILNQIVAKITTDVIDALADVLANTEEGVLVGANAVKELKNTLQSAIDDKASTASLIELTNTVNAKVTNNFTASRVLASNQSGKAVASAVTVTELGYLGGVTSKIQTQLDNKQAQLDSLNIIASNTVTNSVTNDCIIKVDGKSLSPASFPSCRVLLIAMHSSECAIFMFSSVSTSNFVLKEVANTGSDLTMSLSASGIVRVHRKTETGAVAVTTKVIFLAGY